MTSYATTLQLAGSSQTDMHNVTDQVEEAVLKSGVTRGLVTVHCPGSTASVTTIEYESGALADLARALEQIAPAGGKYQHNLRWGDGNGYSHVRAALMKPSLCLPVDQGRPVLGTWQQVVVLDFDNRPRQRQVMVSVLGEGA